MTVRLTILRGPETGHIYEFDDDAITIGSGRRNSIVIRDNDVSANHCRLIRSSDVGYDIEDLDSRYGTFINGQKLLKKWDLKNNSIIELGGQITIEYAYVNNDVTDKEDTNALFTDNPGDQPCLVMVEKGQIKSAYLLKSEEISIGRSIENDIVIQKSDISREHAKLSWDNGVYHIHDSGSRNGTFVNGKQLKDRVKLNHRDLIRLGSLTQLYYVRRSDLPEVWAPLGSNIEDRNDRETNTNMILKSFRKESNTQDLSHHMRQGELEDHILVVYAREDWEPIVAAIVLNLNDSKQKVWVDQYLRLGSDAWKNSVDHAQIECWLLLIVVSEEAMKSTYVREQYRYFYNREKPIILVNYKPVKRLPIQLAGQPLINYDVENLGKMFQQLQHEILHLKPDHLNENHSTTESKQVGQTKFMSLDDES